ncbi:MAG TPA: TatD family hydrolase [Spirochaetota bacterium]|nr:TatD family hydrolase [Spirochaetota bacterium]
MLDAHIHIETENIFFSEFNNYFLNSTNPMDWSIVKDYSINQSNITGFIGVHPWYINKVIDNDWYKKLEDIISDNININVGEIGLDGYKREIDFKTQILFFTKQLELAIKYNRKVSIHCVKAWDIFFKILEDMQIKTIPAILHRFEASEEILKRLLEYDFYISFFYTLQYRLKLQKVFLTCPNEKILIESDAENGPDDTNLNNHYEYCSKLKNTDLNSFKEIVFKNGEIFKSNKTGWRREFRKTQR